MSKGREYNVPEKIEILLNEPSHQGPNMPDSFDALFVDRSSCGTEGTEGTQSRDTHEGIDTITSIISREKWTKFMNIFQNITQNDAISSKNPATNSFEEPLPMS